MSLYKELMRRDSEGNSGKISEPQTQALESNIKETINLVRGYVWEIDPKTGDKKMVVIKPQ